MKDGDCEDLTALASRHLFRRRQLAAFDVAVRSARRAAAYGDWRAQARLLNVAAKASESVARCYGVLPQDQSADESAVLVALQLMAAVDKSRSRAENDDSTVSRNDSE